MKLNALINFLNKELKIKSIKDKSRNGLQFKFGSEIKKIGFAVDACLSTFEKAKAAKVDLLIVHHGVKWTPQKRPITAKKREAYLKKNKLSLYAAHLPLDAHAKHGNNICLARLLKLKKIKKFGCQKNFIGYAGTFSRPQSLKEIASVLNPALKTRCQLGAFGKPKLKTLGIISGGGGGALEDALTEKTDGFLVGEISLGEYHVARDNKINLIVAGHYATETVGLKALQNLLKQKFKIETLFIDNPVNI